MRFNLIIGFLFFGIYFSACKGQNSKSLIPKKSFSVAFYNLENLFDTINDPLTNDEDFTPTGKMKWNSAKFDNKLVHMSEVISQISDKGAPDFLGVCEVENKTVLDQLISTKKLANKKYSIAHFESQDERGIDVAFLYDAEILKKVTAQKIPVSLDNNDKTRDILFVTGLINGKDTIAFFVCHFPSRRGGDESESKRIKASETLSNFIIAKHLVNTNVVILGDFNDNPNNKAMNNLYYCCQNQAGEKSSRMFSNVFWNKFKEHKGSLSYQGHWDMFDQIIVGNSLFENRGGLDFVKKSELVFNKPFLLNKEGKHAGEPFRTFNGNNYINGYSDHLPVIAWFSYE